MGHNYVVGLGTSFGHLAGASRPMPSAQDSPWVRTGKNSNGKGTKPPSSIPLKSGRLDFEQQSTQSCIVDEALKILRSGYLVFERDERVVFFGCDDCRDKWTAKVPAKASKLREMVINNGRCLMCSSANVVRGDL